MEVPTNTPSNSNINSYIKSYTDFDTEFILDANLDTNLNNNINLNENYKFENNIFDMFHFQNINRYINFNINNQNRQELPLFIPRIHFRQLKRKRFYNFRNYFDSINLKLYYNSFKNFIGQNYLKIGFGVYLFSIGYNYIKLSEKEGKQEKK